MPMYTYTHTFEAASDADAASVGSAAGDVVGSFAQGSSNSITGCHDFGGSVVKVSDTDYWHAT